MSKDTFIFDFDGTLADSFPFFVKILKQVKDEFGYQDTEIKPISYYRSHELKELFKEYGVRRWHIPKIVQRVHEEFQQNIDDIKLFLGISEALQQLNEQGIRCGVLSSSPEDVITQVLYPQHKDLIKFVYSGASLFGKHRKLRKMIRREQLDKDKCLYFGDQVRDVEACRKIGIKVCAVTWGFQAEDLLKTRSPDYIISNPSQILELV
jgi:phosphoglycolate phosphatase